MKKEESIFKLPTVISYLVKLMGDKNPGKQIGKTIIQKQMLLFARQQGIDLDYSMYHYGPYSSLVSSDLNYAEVLGLLSSNWIPDKGYFIKSTEEIGKYLHLLDDTEKNIIAKIVEDFGNFNASELAIIATAFFIKDNYKVPNDELPEAVHNAKPNFNINAIKEILAYVQLN